jgi:hypothetical protein
VETENFFSQKRMSESMAILSFPELRNFSPKKGSLEAKVIERTFISSEKRR